MSAFAQKACRSVAYTPKTIRKQAIERIRRKAGEACIAIREESERAIRALEWEASLFSPPDPAFVPPSEPSQLPVSGDCCIEWCTCKHCGTEYHKEESVEVEEVAPGRLECRACLAVIDYGNCCNEACTKEWLAEIFQAHRDKSKGKRFCKQCGSPHEMKSNFCGQCDR